MEKEGLNLKMEEVRQMAEAKGFSADEERIWEMLALIHSEVSEANKAIRSLRNLRSLKRKRCVSIVMLILKSI